MSEVVYIGAVGRSGTTLLERTLATSTDIAALGEMVHVWDRSVLDDEPCGCGRPFSECPFWTEVGDRAFGGWDRVDVAQLRRDRRMVDRNRKIPWLIVPRLARRPFREARARLLAVLDPLYTAIGDVAGNGIEGQVVLVDSSKHPSYLFLLRTLPSHSIRLLHVVRDPRGVAHSWAKRVGRPETGDEMERLDALRAVARWTSHNLLFQLAGLLGTSRQRMTYERFTADPNELFACTASLLGHRSEPLDLPPVEGHVVDLGLDHTASGNPMRFQHGEITVRSDQAWRASMPRSKRVVVSVLTTPLRQVYAR